MKKVCCLYRVSTMGQVEKDDIPMQKQSCREFIAEHRDWQFYKELSEKGVSGFKVAAAKRDAIQELQHEAVAGKFDILLVFMFDRLGWRDDETPFVVEWFVRQGIEVWSVKEGQQKFDSHVDKLTNYIRYWQASGESIKTSMRTKTRLGQIIQEGRFRGGGVPFGYRLEHQGRFNKRNHEVFELVVDEYESGIVRRIFDMYARQGIGTQTITTRLRESSIVNRKGQFFHPGTILNMLKNPTYLGILRSGETRSEVFPHLRLIDDDTWERTQALIQDRSGKNEEKRRCPKKTIGRSLLSGNIFCGHCGGRMKVSSAGRAYERTDGTVIPHKYLRYVCYNRSRHNNLCDGQTGYAAANIDACVESTLTAVFSTLVSIPNDEIISSRFAAQMKDCETRIGQLRKQISGKTSELTDLKAEVVNVIRGKSKWSSELLNEVIATAEAELSALQADFAKLEDGHENAERLHAKLTRQYREFLNWSDTFSTSPMETKRVITSHLIDRVQISRGSQISIDFKIDVEQFLNAV
ncbi:hypothetical protein FACS1894202_12540 [Clostridia bacterium]|nr:hypothetical protein FACS1894202_12540 [Clostridia bacterium]